MLVLHDENGECTDEEGKNKPSGALAVSDPLLFHLLYITWR